MGTTSSTNLALQPQHVEDLKKSGLTDATITKYVFSSINKEDATSLLGFSAPSPGWVIKYPNSDFLKFKPDNPITADIKYLSPRHMSQDLFVTNLASEAHDDILEPYYFCEGEKKCLALEQAGYATIGVPGVWGWKSQGHIIERLSQVNLKDRACYIIFDSDKYYNEHVLNAEKRFAETLGLLGARVKIVNIDPEFGKGVDDQLLKLGADDFRYYLDKAIDYSESMVNEAPILPPLALADFLKKDIPPLEYYVEGILPKQGKTMISAKPTAGKSLFVQNLALAMASGMTIFTEKFNVSKAKVLYLDLEMGESAMKDRFVKMCGRDGIEASDLFVKYIPDPDFLDPKFQKNIEKWIDELKVNVLIIDPIGSAWQGDENDKQQVSKLTSYLNKLILKYGISVLVVHHWRKGTRDFKTGGEMAAGSYKWGAWLDHHITLRGDNTASVTISCEKSRNIRKFQPFLMKLDEKTLWFEFLADFEKKFDESTVVALFNSFHQDRVKVVDICKKAESDKICSGDTIRGLIGKSTIFAVDKEKKPHFVYRKGV